ncbi:MAG: thymidine phosphorylase [Nitrospirota bacterium]
MRAYDIIKKKRDGASLTKDEIKFIIEGYLNGRIPDYQISSLLMAIYFRGMNPEETASLTRIMMTSGQVLNLSDIPGKKIDKHSTGGVGDKVSLILAPLVASAGVIVPMISGRGLGHTGGTLDKLESIPGFRTDLSLKEFKDSLLKIGLAMVGQTEEIAPADKKLYALRDVTATVDSIPLMASSIMSKKLAEGIDGLVLDVKTGSGAFMKGYEDSLKLARTMVETGTSLGVETVALITDMNQPLGRAVGNSLEVLEAIDVLKGGGPEDLVEITIELGAWMLRLAHGLDIEKGRGILMANIKNGDGLKKFKEMVSMQGGDTEVVVDSTHRVDRQELLPSSEIKRELRSKENGYIERIDAESVGIASMVLGAGRERVDSVIDHSAGIILMKKRGDSVRKEEPFAILYGREESMMEKAEELLLQAYKLSDTKPERTPLIKTIITKEDIVPLTGTEKT